MNKLNEKIEYYPNGNVKNKSSFDENGNGIEEWFWEKGNIQLRTPYNEGEKDGPEEYFYKNGNIKRRTPYKEGELDGIEIHWNEYGEIQQINHYRKGKLTESVNFDEISLSV
jgi:antitoxin component YwqK of YwqJK toxin-antitoxin module